MLVNEILVAWPQRLYAMEQLPLDLSAQSHQRQSKENAATNFIAIAVIPTVVSHHVWLALLLEYIWNLNRKGSAGPSRPE